jgi:putative transposase
LTEGIKENIASMIFGKFIVKTYQQGNKGSKRMNVKQVAIRVQAKAYELKQTDYPSYRTVLRVLKPYIEKKDKSI